MSLVDIKLCIDHRVIEYHLYKPAWEWPLTLLTSLAFTVKVLVSSRPLVLMTVRLAAVRDIHFLDLILRVAEGNIPRLRMYYAAEGACLIGVKFRTSRCRH